MWRFTQWPTRWLPRYQRRKPRHFGQTLRHVHTEALLNTLDDTLAEAKIKTLGDVLEDVKVEALIHTLPTRPPEPKAETLGHTLCDVEAEVLVDPLAETSIRKSRDTWRYTGRCGGRSPGLEEV